MRGGKYKLDIMKKFFIFLIALLIIAAGIVVTVLIVNKQGSEEVKESDNPPSTITIDDPAEKVKITFDSDGGNKVSPMTIVKGEPIDLPYTEKEGYSLLGWYLDGKKIEDGFVFEQDATLVAKWEARTKEVEKFTVSFDSKGGSKVSKVEVECGKNLKLPKNPTKDGYTFVRWEDKNGQPIYNDAKLYCENVTLYAVWEKNKEYTCPSGYKPDGTKCTIEEKAKEKCGERGFDYEGKCVTLTDSARKEGDRGCPKKDIHVGSYAGSEEGEMIFAGTYFCYYHKLSYNTQEQCESLSGQFGNFVWRPSNNSCYVLRTTAEMTCDNLTGYVYIAKPNDYSGVNGLNGGCYPVSDKVKYCDSDYTLTNGKCIKTINATLK